MEAPAVTDGPLGRYQKTRVPRLVWVLVWDARWRLEVGSLLPPSSGPTQVGTTPSLMFRALVGPDGGYCPLPNGELFPRAW